MTQAIDEILDDLRAYVAGRGNSTNFCYSKTYSSSSFVRCVDFSHWVGLHLIKNDAFALAVFQAQLSRDSSFSVSFTPFDDGKIDEDNDLTISFEREINRHQHEIKHILQFHFEDYFVGEIQLAKTDLLTAWLLNYPDNQFARIMMPYRLELKNADAYIERYNQRKKKQFTLPSGFPNDIKFNEYQREFMKLPLATRLHVFDVLEYSGFGKKPKTKSLSEMTLYDTRKIGIDENESANILRQSKLITSFPDGTGFISPEYIEVVSLAVDYARKIFPVYYEWKSEVSDVISNQLGVYYYDDTDKNNDGYIKIEE